jgi:cytochrome c oxidase subunit II
MMHVDPYERRWMIATGVTLVVFVLALTVTAVVGGISLPGVSERVAPGTVGKSGPFANPGIRQLGPGRYEAFLRAQTWSFFPNEIHVPAGSSVTFHLTSPDVQHGFFIEGTNVHMMVLPGQVTTLTATFPKAGTHQFWCDEYCGMNHQSMSGQLVVDPVR